MQFDVYRNPSPRSRVRVPYLLDVQAELLDGLATRVVIPLLPRETVPPARILNPIVTIERQEYVLSTAELASVPLGALGEKAGNLAAERTAILAALDLLLTGA